MNVHSAPRVCTYRVQHLTSLMCGCLGLSKGAHFCLCGGGGGAQERCGGGGWRFSGEEGGEGSEVEHNGCSCEHNRGSSNRRALRPSDMTGRFSHLKLTLCFEEKAKFDFLQ